MKTITDITSIADHTQRFGAILRLTTADKVAMLEAEGYEIFEMSDYWGLRLNDDVVACDSACEDVYNYDDAVSMYFQGIVDEIVG